MGEQRHLREERADEPVGRDVAELGPVGGSGRERHAHVEVAEGRRDAREHVAAHGEEAAERHVDDGVAARVDPVPHLGLGGLSPHGRADEGVRRQQLRAVGVVQLLGVVEQEHVAGLRERVAARAHRRREDREGVVPLRREAVAHALAQGAQLVEVLLLGLERGGPRGREAVDLVADGQGARVAEHDVRVARAGGEEREAGAEGEVVDDHLVGAHLVEDPLHGARGLDRLPQQVVAPRLGLEAQGLDHAAARGGEEAAERVVLAGRLVLGLDGAGVGSAAEAEVDPLEAGGLDDAGGRGSGRHDHALAGLLPGRRERDEGEEVGRVVRADDEQGHEALSSQRVRSSAAATSR